MTYPVLPRASCRESTPTTHSTFLSSSITLGVVPAADTASSFVSVFYCLGVIEWGDVGTWVGGAGTTLAFLFAAYVYRRNLTTRREADRQSQARLFDAWVENARWEKHTPEGKEPTDSDPTMLRVETHVSNASAQSMRGVDATVVFGKSMLDPVVSLGVIPPTTPDSPNRRVFWCWSVNISPEHDFAHVLYGMMKLSLSFTDASGSRWNRTEDGELRFLYNLAEKRKD